MTKNFKIKNKIGNREKINKKEKCENIIKKRKFIYITMETLYRFFKNHKK